MLAKDQLGAHAVGFGVKQPWCQHRPAVQHMHSQEDSPQRYCVSHLSMEGWSLGKFECVAALSIGELSS